MIVITAVHKEPAVDIAIQEAFEKLGSDCPSQDHAGTCCTNFRHGKRYVRYATCTYGYSGKSMCYASLLYMFSNFVDSLITHITNYHVHVSGHHN